MSTRQSSKTTRKTTQVTSTTATSGGQTSMKTPQTGTKAGDQGRPRSPLSPTRISRLQEKLDLQNLNDRLATYIDRVRHLENENSRLNVQVQTTQETITREVTNIKSMYEQELSDARKLLDDTAKEKAKMQIEASKWKNEADELQAKFNKKDKECVAYEKRIISLETHNNELQSRYNQAASEKKRLEEEIKSLQSERDKMAKQLAMAKSQLEDETLRRVDLENRVQSLKEELSFKQSIHEKQLSETRLVKQTEISEIDNRIKDQYERKLADTLRDLRDQYETQLGINRDEIESMYESKIEKLQSQVESNTENRNQVQEELRTLRSRSQNFSSQLADLESQNSAQQNRIRDLERMLEQERDWHLKSVQEKESEIQKLNETINEQMREYQDLLDIKVALDLEISAYRKLLELEETRLNITPASSPISEEGGGRGTPVRRTPVRAVKRKRTIVMQSEKKSTSDKYITASAKGDVEIFEHCPEGKFVKLYNKGTKDIQLGGWQLVRQAADEEVTYKFHRSIVIKADSYVTVWSSDASEVTHSPPSDLVMKNQAWAVGDKIATRLVHTNGEEMAVRESSRQVHLAEKSHETGSYLSSGAEEIYHQQGDPENPQERCSIM